VTVDLVTYVEFGRLRLADFLPDPAAIESLADWEYMDDLWIGEGFGFSEFLRLEDDPDVVRSIALDLTALPRQVTTAILDTLRLPLAPGMHPDEVRMRLGEPRKVEQFVDDRISYSFTCGERDRYEISCTFGEAAGLIYVSVLAPTPRWQVSDDRPGEK
jgi:hypothetical protein